jgi:cation:H+ antiporter
LRLIDIASLVGGGVLLYLGAEWLIRGAAGLATKYRVKPLVIGLTVVAYGTSAPELVVGVGAALAGRGGIAFGNAIGSNIANMGLILGVTTLVSPPIIDPTLRRRELPALVLSAIAVPLLLLDGRIGRLEGLALLLAAFAYTALMIRASRTPSPADIAEAWLLRRERRMARAEGAVLVVLYALFLSAVAIAPRI